jgi:hypothetical protein
MSNKHSRPDGCRFFYSKEVGCGTVIWAVGAELKELRLRPSRISRSWASVGPLHSVCFLAVMYCNIPSSLEVHHDIACRHS